MKIITISREFGSGGRELGKRLAEAMNIPCYDHEIIEMIAKVNGFDENYVAHVSEKSILASYPMTIGKHLGGYAVFDQQQIDTQAAQHKIIRQFAMQGDCVIIGRGADVILKDMNPLKIFVHASEESKLTRCKKRAEVGENLTERELLRQMKQVDRNRALYHNLLLDNAWGKKESYHLCINTSDIEIKSMIPALAAYANAWFGK